MVDILRLNQGLEVVFENLGEVILQFGATEVLEDFLPVWRVLLSGKGLQERSKDISCSEATYVVSSQVGLQLSGQNL